MGLPLVAKEGGPSPGIAMLEAQGFWLLPRHKMSVSIEEPLMAGKNFFFLYRSHFVQISQAGPSSWWLADGSPCPLHEPLTCLLS